MHWLNPAVKFLACTSGSILAGSALISHANFQEITKVYLQPLKRKMYEEKNWKKSLNKTKIILFNIFSFLFVCLRCINWVIRFPNTVTYWLVWLYTTSERQILFLSFDYRNYLQCVSMMLRGAWTLNEPFKLPKVFRYLMGWMDTVRAKISLICEIIKGSRSGFHFSNLQKSLFVAKDQTLYITLNYYSHKNSVLHRTEMYTFPISFHQTSTYWS